MNDAYPLLITRDRVLHDALNQINQAGLGILLLINEVGQLLRTITDGDLRRLLLAGAKLTDTLAVLSVHPPIVANEGVSEEQALEIMNRHQVDHLPVVDENGCPIEIILRRDIDTRILLSTPHLSDYEMEYIQEAFRTNWIAPLGPNVDAFELELAAYVGIAHAAALSSGTAAIHLALRVLDIKPGDVVFCSTLTFVASANPILYQGATPVFIDSEPNTWNMSPQALGRALMTYADRGRLPKAVIIVNIYGQSADFDPILALCGRYGVPVIEDAAESLGATYKGRASGTLGRIGVYSFNGNKIITTSGGGMLVSNEREIVEKARFLSTQARESVGWYEHKEIGFNYRMSNILAGIGRGQLKVLEDRVQARRGVFDRYWGALSTIEALEWMPEAHYGRCTRWLSACLLNPAQTEVTPMRLIEMLTRAGIEVRRIWKPMHRQPLFSGCNYYPHEEGFSFSDHAFETGVCLPSGSNMTEAQQARVIRQIKSVFESNRSCMSS